LPGYRPPEVIERERAVHYYRLCGPQYYGLAELLSRALEWRWLRPLLDADADRSDVELRPLIDAGSCRRSAFRRPGDTRLTKIGPRIHPSKGRIG
jgi:hypothetical protein